MNSKFICSFILGIILTGNVYSTDSNRIGVCRDEKINGIEYQGSDFAVLKFENIKKLVVKGRFADNQKLKTLIFEHNDININLPNGLTVVPTRLNPAEDLGLPLDCHVVLKNDLENSAQKIEKYRNIICANNWPNVLFNFTRSLEQSATKYSLRKEDVYSFDLEINFFVVNECSEHDWYLKLKDNSYTVVSKLSDRHAAYRDVFGSNQINGDFDMTAFYQSNDYKFALSIYEFLSAVSTFDSGNVYERALNAIIESTKNEYVKTMCNTLKDAYNFFDMLNSGISYLESQVREQEILKQQDAEIERLRLEEQQRKNKAERKARAEERRSIRDEEDRKKEFKKASKAMNKMFRVVEKFRNNEINSDEALDQFMDTLAKNLHFLKNHYDNNITIEDGKNVCIDLKYYKVVLKSDLSGFFLRYTNMHPMMKAIQASRDNIINSRFNCCILRLIMLPFDFIKALYTVYHIREAYDKDPQKYLVFLEDEI